MYFTISGKEHIPNVIKLLAAADNSYQRKQVIKKEEADGINAMSVIFVKGDENSIYPDVFDVPVFLVSDEVRKVMQMYDDSLIFKSATLSNKKTSQQFSYWLTLMDEIDCLAPSTEIMGNGSLKKLVLDEAKIGKRRMFRVGGISEHIVVINVDIAESILRRFFIGIELKPVQVVQLEQLEQVEQGA